MAPHSSTPAWKIPWAEEPGRLQSMGSQRVRHELATKQQQQQCVSINPKLLNYPSAPSPYSNHNFVFYVYESTSVL